ncbi:MAG: flippase-like domain-containing protein [Desulfarculus sp.]|nr:flippase-like domain-containing protein [Desulfarculus sp.]
MLNWQTLAGLAISLVCLGYVLMDVDFGQLWDLMRHMNWLYALAVNALLAFSFWVRSQRWRVLLAPVKDCRLGGLWDANIIGFMANNVLPARLGELVRALTAQQLAQVPASSALATIVVERILDGLTLLLILFATLIFADPAATAGAFSVGYMRGAGYTLLAGYLAVLAMLFALWRWPQATMGTLCRLAGRLSPRLGQTLEGILQTFHQGLMVLGQTRHLPLLLLLTAGTWLPMLMEYVVFLPAVDLPPSLFLACMAFTGASLAAAVPAGPGYVGTFQLACLWAMMMGGAPQQAAANFAMLFWAVQYFPLTAAGLITMWRRGLTLKGLRQARQAEPSPPGRP